MKTISLTLFTLLLPLLAFSQVIYVTQNGTGNGDSWDNALGDLQVALQNVQFGQEIWVATGNYKPAVCTVCGEAERNLPFSIPNGVKLYGGFAGSESSIDERDISQNLTILSGDIDNDNTLENNSYTIVYTENVSNQTVIDGFTIQQGNADFPNAASGDRHTSGAGFFNKGEQASFESHPIIRNCIFAQNYAIGLGGAFYSNGGFSGRTTPVFENVSFENNTAKGDGGAFYGYGSFSGLCNPEFRNCLFVNNKSENGNGGAIANSGAEQGVVNAIIEDCQFELNEAFNKGGALYSFGKTGQANPKIKRCSLIFNTAKDGGAVYSDGSFSGNAVPVFENSFFENNTASESGGAFEGDGSFEGVSSPVFKDCRFFKNSSINRHGGAIANSGTAGGTAHAKLEDCEFEENEAKVNGGALYNFGNNGHSNPIVKRCLFRKNFAEEGGAIYSDASFSGESSPAVSDSEFIENEVIGDGGAVYNSASGGGLSQGVFERCLFEKNKCANAGGAILNNGADGNCRTKFSNCKFIENSTPNYGGAMYNIGNSGRCNPEIYNCLFAKNNAFSAGGIYNLGSSYGESSPLITNCTFYKNTAEVGSAIYCNATDSTGLSAPIITNSVFYENFAPTGRIFRLIYGKPTVSYCSFDIDDCSILNDGINGDVNCGDGLIFTNELPFEDTLNQKYQLQSGVSFIDAGNSQATQAANIQFDLDGNPRIVNSIVDYGAFEFSSGMIPPPTILTNPQSETLCEDENYTLSIDVEDPTSVTYQWKKDDNQILGATNNELELTSVKLADGGEYTCLVSNQSSSVESTAAIITVNENLSLELEVNHPDTVICEGEEATFEALVNFPGTNPLFEWNLNGQPIPNSNNLNFTSSELKNLDQISCTVLSSEICVEENPIVSDPVIVEVKDCSVGTNSVFKENLISTYPNPVENHLYVTILNPAQGAFVKIYNMQGSEIARQKVIKSDISNVLIFNTQDYPTGVYSIQFIGEWLSSTSIFIKK